MRASGLVRVLRVFLYKALKALQALQGLVGAMRSLINPLRPVAPQWKFWPRMDVLADTSSSDDAAEEAVVPRTCVSLGHPSSKKTEEHDVTHMPHREAGVHTVCEEEGAYRRTSKVWRNRRTNCLLWQWVVDSWAKRTGGHSLR